MIVCHIIGHFFTLQVTYKVVARMVLRALPPRLSPDNNAPCDNNQSPSRDKKDKRFTNSGTMYQFHVNTENVSENSTTVIKKESDFHQINTAMSNRNIDNPWGQISYIYNRFFMFIHIFITVVCFVAVFIYYKW